MKLSIYTTQLTIDGKHTVLYNALSDCYILLKNQLFDIKTINPETLIEKNLSFFNQLKEAGIIIENEIDEVHELKNKISATDNADGFFILHINPTLDCNMKCWYCYEKHVPNSLIMPETKEKILKFIDNLLTERSDLKHFDLGFFGGEPLIHFQKSSANIIEYAAHLCKEKNITFRVHFTSNATLLNDSIIEFLSKYNCGFQITLDGNEEEHDKTRFHSNGRGTYRDIIGNIHKLINHQIGVVVRINYTHKNASSVPDIFREFKDIPNEKRKYLRFDFQCVWQERSTEESDFEATIMEIRRSFEKEGFNVLANYLPKRATDSCYGDKKNHALINYNGDIFGCTARDFSATNRLGVLNEEGEIVYDTEKYEKWRTARFSKPICHTCRIAPVCGGGCTQNAYDTFGSNKCVRGFSEEDKDQQVLNLIDYYISHDKNLKEI